jgi:hypothetical protein
LAREKKTQPLNFFYADFTCLPSASPLARISIACPHQQYAEWGRQQQHEQWTLVGDVDHVNLIKLVIGAFVDWHHIHHILHKVPNGKMDAARNAQNIHLDLLL